MCDIYYRYPAVSGFYKLLTTAMQVCNSNGYFNGVGEVNQREADSTDLLADTTAAAQKTTYWLICKYQKEVMLILSGGAVENGSM